MYKRILLKLSGESLAGGTGNGILAEKLEQYATQIKTIVNKGVQVGIVIGGGNIFRGVSGLKTGIDRVHGDQMGIWQPASTLWHFARPSMQWDRKQKC